MTDKEFIIVIAFVVSIIEIYMILNLFRKKRYEYFLENTSIYLAILIFLYCQYYFMFQINNYIILLALISVIGHSFIGEYLRSIDSQDLHSLTLGQNYTTAAK